MKSVEFVKKIRNYSIASFLIPLIAINSCLLFYKYLGDMNVITFPNLNWNKDEATYTIKKYTQLNNNKLHTFTNCPKYKVSWTYTTIDNQIILHIGAKTNDMINNLILNNKMESITFKSEKNLENRCIKNHQNSYSLIKKFSWLEALIIHARKKQSYWFFQN